MKDLDAYADQMSVGQVKTITTGNTLNYIELLFSKTTKAQLYYNQERNNIQVTFSNTDLRIEDLVCELDKNTLEDLLRSLKKLDNQLLDQNQE